MIVGNAYAGPVLTRLELAMAAECAAISREFPGWDVTWTTAWGYRALKGDDDIGPCTSRSALRCMIALAEHRMAR